MKALVMLYQGSLTALLGLHEGSVKALDRPPYEGSSKEDLLPLQQH